MTDEHDALVAALLIDRAHDTADERLDVVADLIERAQGVRGDVDGDIADVLDEQLSSAHRGQQNDAPHEEGMRLQRAPRPLLDSGVQPAGIIRPVSMPTIHCWTVSAGHRSSACSIAPGV